MTITLNNINSFADLRPLAESCKQDVSFWGWRHVYFIHNGKKHKLSMSYLPQKVGELINKNLDFSLQEREHGRVVSYKLLKFSSANKFVISQKNIITRIFVRIRAFLLSIKDSLSNCFSMPDYNTSDSVIFYGFDFYTRAQFQEFYHCTPEEAERQGHSVHFQVDRSQIDSQGKRLGRWRITDHDGINLPEAGGYVLRYPYQQEGWKYRRSYAHI